MSSEALKKAIRSSVEQLLDLSIALVGATPVGRFVYGRIIDRAMRSTQVVAHRGVTLVLSTPNALSKYRADTFSTKEPETLEWIDRIPVGSVLWDVGANVGLYTCYAAKARGCRVFAFEPSVFNLEVLARNIFLNTLTERVTIIPLPLSDVLATSTLNMTTTDWAGARSTFGHDYGDDGGALQKVFEVRTVGLSMVDAVSLWKFPQPDFIKMDVDGIEHLILKGGLPVLREATGVLIELNARFVAQAEGARTYLQQAGFSLKDDGSARRTSNQIWTK